LNGTFGIVRDRGVVDNFLDLAIARSIVFGLQLFVTVDENFVHNTAQGHETERIIIARAAYGVSIGSLPNPHRITVQYMCIDSQIGFALVFGLFPLLVASDSQCAGPGRQ
jgi:hypothetical protein